MESMLVCVLCLPLPSLHLLTSMKSFFITCYKKDLPYFISCCVWCLLDLQSHYRLRAIFSTSKYGFSLSRREVGKRGISNICLHVGIHIIIHIEKVLIISWREGVGGKKGERKGGRKVKRLTGT